MAKLPSRKPVSPRKIKQSIHHLRPSSRGGMDAVEYEPNEMIIAESYHRPYHVLFGNLRPNEIIILLLFSWETTCPYIERKESHTKNVSSGLALRIKAWDQMFTKRDWESEAERLENIKAAIKVIIEEFVYTGEDVELTVKAISHGLRANILDNMYFV